jgi:polar amino acid transport system substrate-binding protein
MADVKSTRRLTFFVWLFLITSGTCVLVQGQTSRTSSTVRVATRLVKPFVFYEGDHLAGFSVDLWQELCTQTNLQSTFKMETTVQDLLKAVQSGDADLGISAISITAERERMLDLSHPMFEAGLQILTRAGSTHRSAISSIVTAAQSPGILPIIVTMVLITIVAAHLIWWFERGQVKTSNPPNSPNSANLIVTQPHYYPGVLEASWWATSALAAQADRMPHTARARIVASVWLFVSVIFLAYFTAWLTSALTVQQLRGNINGPEDLPGKRVASIQGSTSVDYLLQRHIAITEFASVEQALTALQRNNVDAVVYDAPVLLYYASHEGLGTVQVVGSIFHKEDYGIVFPPESRYRKRINEALLRTKENGTYDRIYRKWFGAPTF